MRTALRLCIALWYLLGWPVHVYLSLFAPETYQPLGDAALISGFIAFWHGTVMPHITCFALLLAGFELLVGLLLISKGKWVKAGLLLSILFNLFLVQMGLGFPASSPLSDLLLNRSPNLIFAALQLLLLQGSDARSISDLIRRQ